MQAVPTQAVPTIEPAYRNRLLRAMDLPQQVLHKRDATASATASCVLLVPASTDLGEQALLHNILAALSSPDACVRSFDASLRRGVRLGDSASWIVFGEDAERALRKACSAAGATQTSVTVTHAPSRLLREPLLKRELWASIRTLRAALAATEA